MKQGSLEQVRTCKKINNMDVLRKQISRPWTA
jgi:hypothetical protein